MFTLIKIVNNEGGFEILDYIIFFGYALLILGVGLWVSKEKMVNKKMQKIIFLQVNLYHGGRLHLDSS